MKDIRDIVIGLFETYGTYDPFELCKCLGIHVLMSDLGDEIMAVFQRTPCGCEIIHINSRLDEVEGTYYCSHELGHAIMHPEKNLRTFIENKLQVKNKYEIEADKFATELRVHIELNDPIYKDMSISEVAATLCVPEKLIRYKFGL